VGPIATAPPGSPPGGSRLGPAPADAIVVGAGIAGLTVAVALHRLGIRAKVVERRPALPRGGGAILLWSNALNAFSLLGLSDAVTAIGTVIDRTEFRSWSGEVLSSLPIGDLSRKAGAPSLVVHRETLLDLLAAAVGDESILFGRRCTAIVDQGSEVLVTLDDGESLVTPLLVGADGIESTVRRAIVGDDEPRSTDHRAWGGSAPIRQDALALGVSSVTHGHGARIWFAPCRNGEVAWIAMASERLLERSPSTQGRRDRVARLFAEAHDPIPAIIDGTPEARMFETPIRYRPASEVWGRGRITLLGDAAHACTPDLAQAACQAIEDAATLARCLADAGDVEPALRRYEARRTGRTRRVVNLSRIALAQGAEENPLLCWLRDRATDVLVRTVARRQIWELLSYRV
jgi:2-polyprenyl-6-methoxyphenol hydroxylase-like FAD-dependent oxidoreductase